MSPTGRPIADTAYTSSQCRLLTRSRLVYAKSPEILRKFEIGFWAIMSINSPWATLPADCASLLHLRLRLRSDDTQEVVAAASRRNGFHVATLLLVVFH